MVRLYGRDEVATLVRGLMRRSAAGSDHHCPVLVCEGPPASGKTELLRALAGLLDGRVPYAHLDLRTVEATLGDDAVPELLAALAFQLARRTGRYGALRFPRLVVGHLVMALNLEWVDRQQARAQVDVALSAHRGVDRWTNTLGEVAEAVLARVPGLQPVPRPLLRRTLGAVVRQVNRWGPGRRLLLGPYQDWYGRQDRNVREPAIEALVGLNRWAKHHDNPDNRQRIASLLLRAFLADLTDNATGGRGDDRWPLNCVVLLDNVDCELGRTFLSQLVQARRDHAAGGLGDADPLTVVVTSRGDLLSEVDNLRVGRGASWWLRYGLRPLTVDETNVMVASLSLPTGNSQRLASALHRLTGGQPAATHLLLEVVGERQTGLVELDDLLAARRQGRSVEDALYDRLLAGIPADAIDDLVTCAAARDRATGRLLAQSGLISHRGVADSVAAIAGLWDTTATVWDTPAGRTGPDRAAVDRTAGDRPDVDRAVDRAAMDRTAADRSGDERTLGPTLIRRLLLRRLALRAPEDPASWINVHQWLYSDALSRGGADRYYAVALDRWDVVAETLTRQLGQDSLPQWLADLHLAVWAPRRGTVSGDSPAAVAQRLAEPHRRADPVFSTVLNLLTSLCVARDPLCGSLRSGLYWQIASRYAEVGQHTGSGSDELAALVHEYEVLARQWQQLAPAQGAVGHPKVGQATAR